MTDLRRILRSVLRTTLAGFALFVLVASGLGCCVFSTPRHRGPVSDHFDGEVFLNPGDTERHGFVDFVRWRMERTPEPWPEVVEGARPAAAPPKDVAGGRLHVTFVNHATVLIQIDGKNVLTDPIWSDRASPFSFVGPRRIRPPGIRFEDLPRIDAVVISHNHYDHFDMATLQRLVRQFPEMRIFVPMGNKVVLEKVGLTQGIELDWDGTAMLGTLRIQSLRSRHFSGRGLCDRNGTLWSAWGIVAPSGTIYFAGDTGYGDHFSEAKALLGDIRLAIIPIGAHEPEWFMGPVHVTPKQAVRAAIDLGASTSLGMHFGTFPLADEGPDDPPRQLQFALEREPAPPQFWVLDFGEGREVPAR